MKKGRMSVPFSALFHHRHAAGPRPRGGHRLYAVHRRDRERVGQQFQLSAEERRHAREGEERLLGRVDEAVQDTLTGGMLTVSSKQKDHRYLYDLYRIRIRVTLPV